MRTTGRILIVFLSLAIALVAYYNLFGTPIVDTIARWTATSAAGVLNIFGASVSTNGTIVGSSSFAYNIVTECTAIGPVVLFAGAVIAYPSSVRSKLLGIATGVVLLTGLNLVRLVTLFDIGARFPDYLPMAHFVVWQSAIIVFAILLWLFWTERVARRSYG